MLIEPQESERIRVEERDAIARFLKLQDDALLTYTARNIADDAHHFILKLHDEGKL